MRDARAGLAIPFRDDKRAFYLQQRESDLAAMRSRRRVSGEAGDGSCSLVDCDCDEKRNSKLFGGLH